MGGLTLDSDDRRVCLEEKTIRTRRCLQVSVIFSLSCGMYGNTRVMMLSSSVEESLIEVFSLMLSSLSIFYRMENLLLQLTL